MVVVVLEQVCAVVVVFSGGGHETGRHTSVVKAVLPAPLGPTSRNVGSAADEVAAWRYRNECSRMGSSRATARVSRMVDGLGDRAWVSQLSSSCQAMAGRRAWAVAQAAFRISAQAKEMRARLAVSFGTPEGPRAGNLRLRRQGNASVGA